MMPSVFHWGSKRCPTGIGTQLNVSFGGYDEERHRLQTVLAISRLRLLNRGSKPLPSTTIPAKLNATAMAYGNGGVAVQYVVAG